MRVFLLFFLLFSTAAAGDFNSYREECRKALNLHLRSFFSTLNSLEARRFLREVQPSLVKYRKNSEKNPKKEEGIDRLIKRILERKR